MLFQKIVKLLVWSFLLLQFSNLNAAKAGGPALRCPSVVAKGSEVAPDIKIANLSEIGSWEIEVIESIWREGREDEFRRPLKLFNSELTSTGAEVKQYELIIAEVKKLKEGHVDTNIQFIYKKDKVVGFFRVVKLDHGYELDQLYISRDVRGKGVGSIVMNHIVENFGNSSIVLYVLADNPAVKFYKRFGFTEVEKLEITKGYDHVPRLPVYKMERN